MAIAISASSKLLFIGDSITDCGRKSDHELVGDGYVRLVRDYLRAKDPASAPSVVNMGISGNKITDLQARWQRDVIEQQPDVLSIMIGINDVWHGLNPAQRGGVPLEPYVQAYHVILRQAQFALPNCQIVLCEPTVIWPPQPDEAMSILQPYVRAVVELAREFKAAIPSVPLHGAFVRAREQRPDIEWAPDGVHPSSSGHMLIARTWLTATGLL